MIKVSKKAKKLYNFLFKEPVLQFEVGFKSPLSKKTRNKPIVKIIRWIALIMIILSFVGFIWTNWNS